MNKPANYTKTTVVLSATAEQSDAMCIDELSTFLALTFAGQTLPVRNNCFLIFWVKEGRGSLLVDGNKHIIAGNTIYCIYPGQLMQFSGHAGIQGCVLSLSNDFCALNDDVARLLYAGAFKLQGMIAITLAGEVKEETEQLLNSMVKEYTGTSEFKNEMLRTLLKVFLIQLSRLTDVVMREDAGMQGDIHLVSQFLEMVNLHFLTMKKVSDYAERLSLAPNYLNIKVKRVSGYTAGYHIRQRIVLEAKRQAHWDQMSLKEISYKLGYSDVAHFSKFFKKEAGVSFSSFKRIQYAR